VAGERNEGILEGGKGKYHFAYVYLFVIKIILNKDRISALWKELLYGCL